MTGLPPLSTLCPASVLVIGDVMLDEYHWCTVHRISPESPVPVCQVSHTTVAPGGAGNVAHNMVAMGSQVAVVGTVGDDSSGDRLRTALKEGGVSIDGVVVVPHRPTILKSRIIAHHQQVVRVDREPSAVVSSRVAAHLWAHIQGVMPTVRVVVISDYGKGTLSDPLIKKTIGQAKQQGCPVLIDPKGSRYHKYRGATLLTPNFAEFCLAIGKTPTTEEAICREGKRLLQRLQLSALLITRSEKGMTLILPDRVVHLDTVAKQVYDITGAGDTVVAWLAVGLANGWSLESAAEWANRAAGVAVSRVGTAVVSVADVIADGLHEHSG